MQSSIVAALTVAVLAVGAVADVSAPPSASAAPTSITTTSAPKGTVVSTVGPGSRPTGRTSPTAAPAGGVAAKYPGMGLYDGFSDTSGQGRYTPSKVLSVQNGALDFWLRSDRGQPLAAAVMPDGYAPHRSAGRVSIRYKTTKTPGYKFVVILWPSSDRWTRGEIDWPEAALGAEAPTRVGRPGQPAERRHDLPAGA